MASSTLGDRLAQLGGGEPGILPEVPSARSKFIQMGLVLLSTAGLAVVSMAFALTDGLKVQWWFAIPLGIGWGFIILNLDRMLILNMRSGNSMWRTAGMILPRIGMAALLGIVISTPIVLRVFADEIATNVTVVNAQAANSLGQTRAKSPTATALKGVEAKISTDEGILAGTVPGLTTANVTAANGQLATAQSNLADKRQVATDAYDKMTCELDGSNCQGLAANRVMARATSRLIACTKSRQPTLPTHRQPSRQHKPPSTRPIRKSQQATRQRSQKHKPRLSKNFRRCTRIAHSYKSRSMA